MKTWNNVDDFEITVQVSVHMPGNEEEERLQNSEVVLRVALPLGQEFLTAVVTELTVKDAAN